MAKQPVLDFKLDWLRGKVGDICRIIHSLHPMLNACQHVSGRCKQSPKAISACVDNLDQIKGSSTESYKITATYGRGEERKSMQKQPALLGCTVISTVSIWECHSHAQSCWWYVQPIGKSGLRSQPQVFLLAFGPATWNTWQNEPPLIVIVKKRGYDGEHHANKK